jgi:hypothetical protein
LALRRPERELKVFVRDWLTDSGVRNGFADLPHMYDCDMWKIGAAHRLALGMAAGLISSCVSPAVAAVHRSNKWRTPWSSPHTTA